VTVALLDADGGPEGGPLVAVDNLLATVEKVARPLASERKPRQESPAAT